MKKNKKFAKLGVALLSTAVLSTVSQCYSIPFLENTNVVYADESTPIAITVEAVEIGTHTSLGTFGSYTVSRDGSVTITAPEVEGYELSQGGLLDGNGYYYLDINAKGNVLTVNGSALQESEKTGVARFYYHKLESNTESLPYTVEWYVDGQYYDGYTGRIKPGELYERWVADRGGSPAWSAFADLPENSPQYYEITYEKVAAGENYYRFDLVSKDKEPTPEPEVPNNPSEEAPIQFTVSHYETLDDSGSNLKMLDTTTYTLKPGEYVDVAAKEFPGYRLVDGMTARVYYEDIIKLDGPYWEFLYVLDSVEEPTNGNNSTDTNTVNYTIQLVDQDYKVIRSTVETGVEGTGTTVPIPKIDGYLFKGYETPVGTDFSGKQSEILFPVQKDAVITLHYQHIPSITEIISPEKRAEYQEVYDEFHKTILEAYTVYKNELGVNGIAYDKSGQLTKDLQAIHGELVINTRILDTPLGTVLPDDYFINAIVWSEEYWNHQIEQLKTNTQTLKTAMANIAASKAEPTVPVDQPITIKVVYRETQIEPGQKITPFKEETFTITPGESVTLAPKTFDGWKLVVGSEQTVTYEQAKRKNVYYFEYVMDSGKTQGDNPVDNPSEQPEGQPISVTFRFVDTDGNIIHQDISWSVSNGGTPAINEAPAIDGYELVDPTQAEMLVTYEQAKENGVYIIKYTKKITPPSDNPSGSTDTPSSGGSNGSTDTPSSGDTNSSTVTPPSDSTNGSTDTPSSGDSNGSTDTPSSGDTNSSTVAPPSDSTNGSTNTPSGNSNGSTVTPPSDNSKGSTVTAPKDKEKDSTSNSNISVGGDKQPTDNKKTEQLAVDTKEKAATSATDSKKEEKASSGTKTLPNTGQATSVSEMTGFMMLGLTGLAFTIKKRRRNG
ncbi:LPXTG cell wall anchor domain-containing protein [Streptococcus suis]|nr:LPXTG cell wall anchor domain-containing protein [Streptococcus suis]